LGELEARRERLRRYFSPGPNLAAHLVYLVPLLGVVLLIIGGHAKWLQRPWLLGGFALWAVTVGIAHVALLPAQTRLQEILSPGVAVSATEVVAVARRAEAAAAVISACFVGAVILMVAQPG
jgi:hypothetical protein